MTRQKFLFFCRDILNDNHTTNWIDNMLSLGMCLEAVGNRSCLHHTHTHTLSIVEQRSTVAVSNS